MKKLNYKHIALHFLSIFLVAYAFRVCAYLTNVELSEIFRTSPNPQTALMQRGIYTVELTSLQITIALAHTVGILAGFILCLLISKRRGWQRVNTVLAALLVAGISYWNITGRSFVDRVLLFPGSFSSGVFYYLVNASVVLTTGLLLFCIKKPVDRIYPVPAGRVHVN